MRCVLPDSHLVALKFVGFRRLVCSSGHSEEDRRGGFLSIGRSMRGMWPRSTRASSFLCRKPQSDFSLRGQMCRSDSSDFNFGIDATRGRDDIEGDQQTTVRGKCLCE